MTLSISGTTGLTSTDTQISYQAGNTTTGTGGFISNTSIIFLGNNTINATMNTTSLKIGGTFGIGGGNALQGEFNATGLTVYAAGVTPQHDGVLHVMSGSAGAVTAQATADELVVEGSGNTGLSILSPDASTSRILFGTPSNTSQGEIIGDYTNNQMKVGTARSSASLVLMSGNETTALTLDSSQNLQFNSGYGSVATAYGCRAWVQYDASTNSANLSATYSQSGTTVTVTATNHGLIVGNVIYADVTSGTAVNGTYTVATVTSSNVFTYTAGTSLTTSGNMTLRRNPITGSGNISSVTDNATGDFTLNFTVAMPDANYCCVGSTVQRGGGSSPGSNYSLGFGATAGNATVGTYTASAVEVFVQTSGGNASDRTHNCVAVFR